MTRAEYAIDENADFAREVEADGAVYKQAETYIARFLGMPREGVGKLIFGAEENVLYLVLDEEAEEMVRSRERGPQGGGTNSADHSLADRVMGDLLE